MGTPARPAGGPGSEGGALGPARDGVSPHDEVSLVGARGLAPSRLSDRFASSWSTRHRAAASTRSEARERRKSGQRSDCDAERAVKDPARSSGQQAARRTVGPAQLRGEFGRVAHSGHGLSCGSLPVQTLGDDCRDRVTEVAGHLGGDIGPDFVRQAQGPVKVAEVLLNLAWKWQLGWGPGGLPSSWPTHRSGPPRPALLPARTKPTRPRARRAGRRPLASAGSSGDVGPCRRRAR